MALFYAFMQAYDVYVIAALLCQLCVSACMDTWWDLRNKLPDLLMSESWFRTEFYWSASWGRKSQWILMKSFTSINFFKFCFFVSLALSKLNSNLTLVCLSWKISGEENTDLPACGFEAGWKLVNANFWQPGLKCLPSVSSSKPPLLFPWGKW